MNSNQIIVGDCLEELRKMPDESVNCIITSPPYFGLRSYLPDDHPGKAREIGLEGDLQDYINNLVAVFGEARRVLRDDGTLWLNLGDSYWGSGKAGKNPEYQKKHTEFGKPSKEASRFGAPTTGKNDYGLKAKDLIGVPWRIALALQADGWYLRDAIVWAKGTSGDKRQGSVMPSSVKDRFCSAYEMVFLLSKSPRYQFDLEAVKEDALSTAEEQAKAWASAKSNHALGSIAGANVNEKSGGTGSVAKATPRNVWLIGIKPFKEAHFATFPSKLVEPCVKAGCPEGGIVLDPFFGAGTTGLVAKNLGRRYVGIELSEEYAELARRRIQRG